MQSRELPKAWRGAEACNFSVKNYVLQKLDFSDIISEFLKREARKNVLLKHFLHSFISLQAFCVSFLCSMFLSYIVYSLD